MGGLSHHHDNKHEHGSNIWRDDGNDPIKRKRNRQENLYSPPPLFPIEWPAGRPAEGVFLIDSRGTIQLMLDTMPPDQKEKFSSSAGPELICMLKRAGPEGVFFRATALLLTKMDGIKRILLSRCHIKLGPCIWLPCQLYPQIYCRAKSKNSGGGHSSADYGPSW